jgi:hypothetical protein
MIETKFLDMLKRMCDEGVKVRVYAVASGVAYSGYIIEVGSNYIRFRDSKEKECADRYFQLALVTHVSTEWKE